MKKKQCGTIWKDGEKNWNAIQHIIRCEFSEAYTRVYSWQYIDEHTIVYTIYCIYIYKCKKQIWNCKWVISIRRLWEKGVKLYNQKPRSVYNDTRLNINKLHVKLCATIKFQSFNVNYVKPSELLKIRFNK